MAKFNKTQYNPNKVEVRFYNAWRNMIRRCRGRTEKDKKQYFDRGIKVCKEWQIFENFFIDMWDSFLTHYYSHKKDTQLDRTDNDKGYSKENCRWLTASENSHNRRDTVYIKGKKLSEWSKILGIDTETLRQRYLRKKSIDEILSNKKRR